MTPPAYLERNLLVFARSLVTRAAVTGAVTAGVVLCSAVPALAHVTVNPSEEVQGGYTKLAFRVPNESDSASTVKLTVRFPQDTPFASVRTRPHPGWTARVVRAKLPKPVDVGDFEVDEAVTSITWTAKPGVKVGPDEFEEFEVAVGPLPRTETIAFPAVQTYDDGTVVAWDDPVRAGQPEPEHPAPVLTLVPESNRPAISAASDSGTKADQSDSDQTARGGADQSRAAAASSRTVDGTARALSAAALVVGVVCLVTAMATLVVVRRRVAGS